jgi:putative transposase
MGNSDRRNRKTRRFYDAPGQTHEFTFSCYHRMPLLAKDRTRTWVIEALDAARRTYGFHLIAYVIMPEHVHVLLMPGRVMCRMGNVARFIKQSVARRALAWLREHNPAWLTRLAGECAGGRTRYHFWQPGGGYDRNIDQLDTLGETVDYAHGNPIRRGLVLKATDWVWSSARWYASLDQVMLEMDRVEL